jgi:hypothetical protein
MLASNRTIKASVNSYLQLTGRVGELRSLDLDAVDQKGNLYVSIVIANSNACWILSARGAILILIL